MPKFLPLAHKEKRECMSYSNALVLFTHGTSIWFYFKFTASSSSLQHSKGGARMLAFVLSVSLTSVLFKEYLHMAIRL